MFHVSTFYYFCSSVVSNVTLHEEEKCSWGPRGIFHPSNVTIVEGDFFKREPKGNAIHINKQSLNCQIRIKLSLSKCFGEKEKNSLSMRGKFTSQLRKFSPRGKNWKEEWKEKPKSLNVKNTFRSIVFPLSNMCNVFMIT